MPDADRKRARDEAGSAEAGAGLPIDTQAGFTMLRMMLPALRPQQKNSRCAEDTLALIIEQWVIDAKAALRESGGGEAFASYTPTLRKALDPKQRQKARKHMRADAVLSKAMSAVSAAAPEEKPLVIEFVRELATPEGRARLISSYGGQHEDHGDDADDGGADDEAGGQPACAACTMTGFEREVRARVCARGSGRRIVRARPRRRRPCGRCVHSRVRSERCNVHARPLGDVMIVCEGVVPGAVGALQRARSTPGRPCGRCVHSRVRSERCNVHARPLGDVMIVCEGVVPGAVGALQRARSTPGRPCGRCVHSRVRSERCNVHARPHDGQTLWQTNVGHWRHQL